MKASAVMRPTVGRYLGLGFALCLAAVTTVVAVTGFSVFERERSRVAALLRMAAESQAVALESDGDGGLETLLAGATAEFATLDRGSCSRALPGLASATDSGHLHLFDPDGAEVCSLRAPALVGVLPVGPWFGTAKRERRAVDGGEIVDPLSGHPATITALPVPLDDGRVAVVAVVLYTGRTPLAVPRGLPSGTVIVALDETRTLVVAASADAPAEPGRMIAGTALGRTHGGTSTFADVDGRRRMYVDVHAPGRGWHVLAGLDESEVVAPARRELTKVAGIGAATIALVGLLGAILHRRLVRPVRRLGRAIEAAWQGDESSRAPQDGPREVVRVAEVFNELIAERVERERALRTQATHDPLTGLLNRNGLAPELAALVAGGAAGGSGAVLFLDLDRFKLINDTHGHSVGDTILVELADRLRRAGGPGVTIGRFGGDEFLALCPRATSERDAIAVAKRLGAAVKDPVPVGGSHLYVGGSIGIAMVRPDATADALVRAADTAMYRAKRRHPGRWCVFDDGMWTDASRRLSIERDLHESLRRLDDEFVVHYQPIVSLPDRGIVGVEALLRWAHPERGLVPPTEFIPVAEDVGVIGHLGHWVLRRAAQQAAEWSRRGLTWPVSVNVSIAQLTAGDLVDQVRSVLEETGVAPELLVVEITESALAEDVEQIAATLHDVRATGIRVAVDDFGTGYSSLAYLRSLPVDIVKIDRSFVDTIDRDPVTKQIVRTILSLASTMALHTVAEGVETDGQRRVLEELECATAQGWLFSRAVPARELESSWARPDASATPAAR